MTSKQKLQSAYIQMQKASGIAPGDRVRVLRKAKADEMGWTNVWVGVGMDPYVGQEAVVERLAGSDGVVLIPSADGRLTRDLGFPFFVLEIVEKAPKAKQVRLTEQLSADVYQDKVTFEYQDAPYDMVPSRGESHEWPIDTAYRLLKSLVAGIDVIVEDEKIKSTSKEHPMKASVSCLRVGCQVVERHALRALYDVVKPAWEKHNENK